MNFKTPSQSTQKEKNATKEYTCQIVDYDWAWGSILTGGCNAAQPKGKSGYTCQPTGYTAQLGFKVECKCLKLEGDEYKVTEEADKVITDACYQQRPKAFRGAQEKYYTIKGTTLESLFYTKPRSQFK